jgi:hypothetical protein
LAIVLDLKLDPFYFYKEINIFVDDQNLTKIFPNDYGTSIAETGDYKKIDIPLTTDKALKVVVHAIVCGEFFGKE